MIGAAVTGGTNGEGKENKKPKQVTNNPPENKKKKNDKKKEDSQKQPNSLEEAIDKVFYLYSNF